MMAARRSLCLLALVLCLQQSLGGSVACVDDETRVAKEAALAQSEDLAAAVIRAAIGVDVDGGAKYDEAIARAQHTDPATFAWRCDFNNTLKLHDNLLEQAQVAKEVSVDFATLSTLTKRLQCIVNSGLDTLGVVQVIFELPAGMFANGPCVCALPESLCGCSLYLLVPAGHARRDRSALPQS